MQNTCQYCNKEFKNHGALLMHEKTCSKNLEAMKCPLCGRSFNSGNQLTKHKFHCNQKTPEERISKSFNELQDNLFCQYCNKQCHNRNSLLNHERKCKLNPNRVDSYFIHYNPSHPVWNKGLTVNTDERVAKYTNSIKQWHKEHPHATGGMIPKNAKVCKFGTYKGIYCDSSWELAVLIYHLDHHIDIHRNFNSFNYTYNNKVYNYYPDFIIDNNTFIEVKGIYRENDQYKIEQFPTDKTLYVIDKSNISKYLKYCNQVYGDISLLYDRNYPSWLDCKDKNKKYFFKIREDI